MLCGRFTDERLSFHLERVPFESNSPSSRGSLRSPIATSIRKTNDHDRYMAGSRFKMNISQEMTRSLDIIKRKQRPPNDNDLGCMAGLTFLRPFQKARMRHELKRLMAGSMTMNRLGGFLSEAELDVTVIQLPYRVRW